MNPRMVAVGHAVELDHRDTPVAGLIGGALEVGERPIGPGIARRRNEQRMITTRFVGETAAPLIGVLRLGGT